MSSSGANIWGVISGALGTLGLLPIAAAIIHSQLPSVKFRKLEETLSDTESLLDTIGEEGLLDGNHIELLSAMERRLSRIRTEADIVSIATHRATTLALQFRGLCQGLSYKICLLQSELKRVRADIVALSLELKHRHSYSRSASASSISQFRGLPVSTSGARESFDRLEHAPATPGSSASSVCSNGLLLCKLHQALYVPAPSLSQCTTCLPEAQACIKTILLEDMNHLSCSSADWLHLHRPYTNDDKILPLYTDYLVDSPASIVCERSPARSEIEHIEYASQRRYSAPCSTHMSVQSEFATNVRRYSLTMTCLCGGQDEQDITEMSS